MVAEALVVVWEEAVWAVWVEVWAPEAWVSVALDRVAECCPSSRASNRCLCVRR